MQSIESSSPPPTAAWGGGGVAPAAASGSSTQGKNAPESGSPSPAVTPAQLKAAVHAANQALDQSNRELSFVFDDTLGRMLVKIVDTRTNTVVRQIPPEEMLKAARALSGASKRGALLTGRA